MLVTTPTDFVLKYAPWSISKLNIAEQCPQRFYLQYVNKIKQKYEPNEDALVGIATHKIMEYLASGRPVDFCFNTVIQEFKLTTNEIDRVQGFKTSATSFMRKFHKYMRINKCTLPVMEQRLAIDFKGNATPFFNPKGFMRGVIDLYTVFNKNKSALIIDHKTGKEHELDTYDSAFNVYMLLLAAKIPTITNVAVGINFLLTESVKLKNKGKRYDVTDKKKLTNNLVQLANKQTRYTYNFNQCNVSPLCGWCDVKNRCQKYRKS